MQPSFEVTPAKGMANSATLVKKLASIPEKPEQLRAAPACHEVHQRRIMLKQETSLFEAWDGCGTVACVGQLAEVLHDCIPPNSGQLQNNHSTSIP